MQFRRLFSGAVIQPLKIEGPCLLSEVPLPEISITNWSSPTLKVHRTGLLQLRSIDNCLLSKCAPVEVKEELYVTEAPNSTEIDL